MGMADDGNDLIEGRKTIYPLLNFVLLFAAVGDRIAFDAQRVSEIL